jgi:hypothetical protein
MNRTRPAKDVPDNGGRRVADQFQNLGHGDHVAYGPEINAWHRLNRPNVQSKEQRRGTRTHCLATALHQLTNYIPMYTYSDWPKSSSTSQILTARFAGGHWPALRLIELPTGNSALSLSATLSCPWATPHSTRYSATRHDGTLHSRRSRAAKCSKKKSRDRGFVSALSRRRKRACPIGGRHQRSGSAID